MGMGIIELSYCVLLISASLLVVSIAVTLVAGVAYYWWPVVIEWVAIPLAGSGCGIAGSLLGMVIGWLVTVAGEILNYF